MRNRGILAPHSTPDILALPANGDHILRTPSSAPAEVESDGAGGTGSGMGAKTLGFSGLGLLSSSSSSSTTAMGHEKLSKTRSDWFSSLFSPSKSRHNSSSTDTQRYSHRSIKIALVLFHCIGPRYTWKSYSNVLGTRGEWNVGGVSKD